MKKTAYLITLTTFVLMFCAYLLVDIYNYLPLMNTMVGKTFAVIVVLITILALIHLIFFIYRDIKTNDQKKIDQEKQWIEYKKAKLNHASKFLRREFIDFEIKHDRIYIKIWNNKKTKYHSFELSEANVNKLDTLNRNFELGYPY